MTIPSPVAEAVWVVICSQRRYSQLLRPVNGAS